MYSTLVPPTNNLQDIYTASVQIGNYCSGTVINDPDLSDGEQFTVITAKHCLGKEQGIGTVLTVNVPQDNHNTYTKMTEIKVIVTDISKLSDLILLQGMKRDEGLDVSKVDILEDEVKFGDYAISVSYPYGLSKFITDGYLGYVFPMLPFADVSISTLYQLSSVPATAGSSGSGLFKEDNGQYKLIGVLTGGMGFITCYTPVEEIRVFLGLNKKEN